VNVSDSESEITTGVMMTATVVEVSPVETKTENDMKIDEVVELYEKIADRKVELQIKRLDEETQ